MGASGLDTWKLDGCQTHIDKGYEPIFYGQSADDSTGFAEQCMWSLGYGFGDRKTVPWRCPASPVLGGLFKLHLQGSPNTLLRTRRLYAQ